MDSPISNKKKKTTLGYDPKQMSEEELFQMYIDQYLSQGLMPPELKELKEIIKQIKQEEEESESSEKEDKDSSNE